MVPCLKERSIRGMGRRRWLVVGWGRYGNTAVWCYSYCLLLPVMSTFLRVQFHNSGPEELYSPPSGSID